ncbi:restriction endonuclease [Aliarcobacter butzleri]|uniref:restriction endonuclease n=1 Tax=Aliarcobacter butzleri TaxID=28197 RepID=UPI003BB0CD75
MNEIYILIGVTGFIYIFTKSKLNKYKKIINIEQEKYELIRNTRINEQKNFDTERNILYSEIKDKNNTIRELEKKLPKIYTKEEQINMKKFGDDFEKFVGKCYENNGYKVEYRGLNLGVLDKGIDLIAKKNNKILLIQCKYWKKKDSITHNMVKEFYGNCNFYIDNNKLDRNNVTCIYAVTKQDSISSLAYELFKTNYINCRYELHEY